MYVQKTNPPVNRVYSFASRSYVGGINNRYDLIEDSDLTDSLNMFYEDEILLETRRGQAYKSAVVYTGEIVFQDEFVPYDEAPKKIVCTKTKLYVDDVIVKTVTNGIQGVTHQGKYYFADGTNLYCYGKFPIVTSTYRRVTGTPVVDYVILRIKSPEAYTPLATGHTEGVWDINYTNLTLAYEPCENENVDPFKGANVVPSSVMFMVSHNSRLFMSGDKNDDDNVFITDVRTPFYFPVYLPIQVPPNSDAVKALKVYDDSVVVCRSHDLHVISGATNNPNLGYDVFRLKRINTHTGIASGKAVDVVNNFLFFLGNDGVPYAISSTTGDEKLLKTQIIGLKIDLMKAPFGFNMTQMREAVSIYHSDVWYLAVGDMLLTYNYRTRGWLRNTFFDVASFFLNGDDVVWGTSTGRLVHFYEGYLDFGKPYQSYMYSKIYNMNDPNSFKQFRDFFLVAHTYDTYNSDIDVVFEIDYSDVAGNITVKNQIAIWGKAKFGDRFINRRINDSYPIIIGRRGRNIRFKVSNRFYIHGEVATYADLEYYIGRGEGVVVFVTGTSSYYKYTDRIWVLLEAEDLEQKMKIYQINGDYELRGKR